MRANEAKKKTCSNPSCGAEFVPGHYGDRQQICGEEGCRKWWKLRYACTRGRPRGLDPADIDSIKKRLEGDAFHSALIAMMVESALRKGEALGLTWRDVLDPHGAVRKVFVVRGQWSDAEHRFKPAKQDRIRKGFIFEWGLASLAKLRAERKDAGLDERVFKMSEAYCWEWFGELQNKLCFEKHYRIHDLRHTAALATLRRTRRLDLVRTLLGHRHLSTTEIYVQQSDEETYADMLG